MNNSYAEQWLARCSLRLMTLQPESPLDGTDWDEIAGDLLEAVLRDDGWRADGVTTGRPWLSPEFAAESYVGMQ